MDLSELKFRFRSLPQRFGISSRQIIIMIVLTTLFMTGMILSHYHNSRDNFSFGVANEREYNDFQNKVTEIESLYYASKRIANFEGQKLITAQININHAPEAELARLPGIGPALAKRIVEYRQKNGKFARLSDLKLVKGIGEKKFNKLKAYIVLD